MHRTARQIASATALREGDFERACAFAEAAIAADPLDEEAYRARMLALYRAGESGKALAAYEELRRVLGDELGADPSKESESLYLSILRGEDLGAGSAPAPSPQPSEHAAVGRDRELRILQEAWQSARTGGPLLALLMGEPGVSGNGL